MAGGKSKASYLYSIIGVSLVLFVLGTLGWILINGRGLSRVFKEDIEVSVEFHDNTREENIQQMRGILQRQPFVRNMRYISKEEALKMQSAADGEDILATAGFNPLFSSIVLKLKSDYVNKDSLSKIKTFIMQSNIVRDVSYPTGVVEQINKNVRKIGIIMAVVSVLLLAVVVVLIDNTVKLAMFSNRFLIKTMQMVGATRWFISKPFDRRAVLNGLISGSISVVGLWFLITFAESWFPDLKQLREPMWLGLLMGGMILLGMLMSFVSTHRSVLKYLKMQVEELY